MRKLFYLTATLSLLAIFASAAPPNVVILFADDLGYGDLGVFGHPTIRTPRLDRMASEGQKWTNFYVAASVCTPSRAGLLTGRYPVRSGMASDVRRVLFPDSTSGLPADEVTIAEVVKERNYATAAIGKWHLGHLPDFLPTTQGFDTYLGIPYSNDMDRVPSSPAGRAAFLDPRIEYWNVPLMRDTEVVERPADQNTITRRYTEEAIRFIRANRDRPFFVYLAYNLPHVPLFRSPQFEGVSTRGLYGDVVEEIDWSVGQVLDTLREEGLAENTLVVFTSDNGPWLTQLEQGGSAGLLRGGKGSTWEGGMREPTVFWWPGTVVPRVVDDLGSTLDLLPTIASLAGAAVPDDRILDGFDLSAALLGTGSSPRDHMIYYRGTRVFAVRLGEYKAHYITQPGYGTTDEIHHNLPLLFDLAHDPSEQYNIAPQNREVVADIQEFLEKHQATVEPAEDQLRKR